MAATEIKVNSDRENSPLRRRRRKNLTLMVILFAWVIIMYFVAILRMGGS